MNLAPRWKFETVELVHARESLLNDKRVPVFVWLDIDDLGSNEHFTHLATVLCQDILLVIDRAQFSFNANL